jgi:L-threonylcarbamoyladenylate synthase
LLLVEGGKVPEEGNGIYLQYRYAPSRSDITVVQMPSAPAEYAASLYTKLHEADAANYAWIAVDSPPETPDWEAIHDRLTRASS